uniref:Goadsporin biosynthetic protein n=1 Tax=Streptomyces sp. TP-A0584 TaxID=314563 RepID=Q3C2F2_9ACTN|nr:goadsporin biosynthetic protein [Streptomyces sp. TP-A0584]
MREGSIIAGGRQKVWLPCHSIDALPQREDVYDHIEELSLHARSEVFGAASLGLQHTSNPERRYDMARGWLRRGLTVKLLVYKKAARDSRAYARLQRLRRDGAQIRLSHYALDNLLICDRRQAAVFHSDTGMGAEAVLVSEPHIVSAMDMLLQQAWATADDLDDYIARPLELSKEDQHLLTLLVDQQGKDSARARALGVSLRTFHRRVAALYERLGVATRPEAVLVAQQYRQNSPLNSD